MTARLPVLVSLAITVLFAQSASPPEIEVASVKANKTVHNGIGNKFGPQSMNWTNAPLATLIGAAYHLPGYRIVGAGGWLDSDRWDIMAKITAPTTMDQKSQLLQSLLADRFHLKCHWETRDLPLYRLIVAPGGPKFKESTAEEKGGVLVGNGSITAHHTGMPNFLFFLAGELQQTVIDETGLHGEYTLDLHWSPAGITPSGAGDPPDIFAAIEDQLGLKLKASKGSVEVLVVDRAEKPSEN